MERRDGGRSVFGERFGPDLFALSRSFDGYLWATSIVFQPSGNSFACFGNGFCLSYALHPVSRVGLQLVQV